MKVRRTLCDDDEWEDEGRRSPTRSRASTSNHSEIEKRRRDRMNELISQLSALVPAAFKRKLDKLSVLRLTLQHINSISSFIYVFTNYCIDSFIVVTDLDSGNILYASESVAESTSVAADEIVSRNWFDLLHPDDTQAFKNEMMTFFTESRTSADTGATYRKIPRDYIDTLCENINFRSSSTTNPYCKYRCFGFLRKSNTPVAVLLLMKSSDEFRKILELICLANQSIMFLEVAFLCHRFAHLLLNLALQFSDAGERFQMKISVNGRITHCDPE
uniref:BHLH domain-containing protein n=1 Tax=Parascaris equorum TaxID=6256 RepID=A0A914S1R9_PAREQ